MPEPSQPAVVLAPPHDTIMPAYPEDKTTIPVFLGCDDNFLPHALAVIASVMAHASPENNYDLFIVQSGIPQERMNVAAEWMRRYPNATFRFVDIEPYFKSVQDTLTVTREYSVAAFFRIFAPALFSQYKRIAYLDSDIAVLGDVAEFYHFDLEGMEAGAIKDLVTVSQSQCNQSVAEFWQTQLGKTPGEDYFFSGGLVMDLEMMRRNNTEQKILERVGKIKGSKLPDQDVMNSVLNGKVKMLPCAWNCLDWMCDEEEEAPNFLLLKEEFLHDIRAARRDVKVVHFAEKKPWTMEYRGKNADKYWTYAAETPFYSQLLDQLRRECNPLKLWWRRLLTRMQEGHFITKQRTVPGNKRGKYEARLRNLRWRRKGLARQKKFVEELLRTGKIPVRRQTKIIEKGGNV